MIKLYVIVRFWYNQYWKILNLLYSHQLKNLYFYVKLVFAFILQFTDKNKRTSTYYAFKNELSCNLSSLLWRVLAFQEEVRLHRYISNT